MTTNLCLFLMASGNPLHCRVWIPDIHDVTDQKYNILGGSMNAIPVVDIFCGVGGLTHGFVKEGFNVVAGLDIDSSCGYAYEQNNGAKFLCKKIEDVEVQDILDLHPLNHIKVLVGCAPCQPFSKYRSKNGPKDEKWKLLDVFANLIAAVQPHVVSMENVPELIKFNQGTVYANFIKSLIAVEYIVTPYLVYCP